MAMNEKERKEVIKYEKTEKSISDVALSSVRAGQLANGVCD